MKMVDLNEFRNICGGEAVSIFVNILDELKKGHGIVEEKGRIGNRLVIKYKLNENGNINFEIYPENKVLIYGTIGSEKSVTYDKCLEELRNILKPKEK
jgi:hypothetical protein